MGHWCNAGNEGVNIRFLQESVLGSLLLSIFRANHNKSQVMTQTYINRKENWLLIQTRLDLLRRWVHLNNMHFTNVTCQGTHPGTKKGGLTCKMGQCIPEAVDMQRRQRQ